MKSAQSATRLRVPYFLRAAIFYLAGTYALFPLLDMLLGEVAKRLGIREALTPGYIGLGEFRNFLVALFLTGVFAYFEHRRPDSYGLDIRRVFEAPLWEGFGAGIIMAGAVAVGMIALGGMQVHGFAADPGTLLRWGFEWLLANICVGVAEEFWFRSYLQQTLWKSIGFWPAAITIALIFASEHYFFKQGENIWDVITLVSLSLLLSFSMLRTGTLWFAVGFHIAFDYMQLFVIGTPNGSQRPADRLLDASFNGPAWLTGGVLGTEASFLMYPAIALLWVYVWWRYRENEPLQI